MLVEQGGLEFGIRKRGFQRVDGVRDPLIEHQAADRELAGALEAGELDALGVHLCVEHRTAADLGPVVILSVNPEHRDHGRTVLARDLCGQLHRRQRLEQREQRATEKPRLLSGDDDDSPWIGEPLGGRSRCGGRLAPRSAVRRSHVQDRSARVAHSSCDARGDVRWLLPTHQAARDSPAK